MVHIDLLTFPTWDSVACPPYLLHAPLLDALCPPESITAPAATERVPEPPAPGGAHSGCSWGCCSCQLGSPPRTVDLEGGDEDLRCVCMKTTSLVRSRHISSLEVIGVSDYCPTPQMIASLKDGRKICLDPNAPLYKKIIRKLLKS
uniref:Multifunctional fusion protein n=1 Tax=Callorhinus ursinus TaxID=34884 RepID=A0A3Q7RQ76_CALUR|nr:platelet factor 4-like [Callorhinus ursinus]